MALLVQKYGGEAVASSARIKHVATNIINSRQQGHDVVVVVSAMRGETNRLIELAKQFDVAPNPREYAVLVSTGEQVTMSLLCMALMAQGQPACSYTGSQIGLLTSNSYQKAQILAVNCAAIQNDLSHGKVVVIAGFQGVNDKGEITTLGRGGSDATAVAIAAALKADECQFYKDVAGIYTADPKIVPDARLLSQISFAEMTELAVAGAKVLQDQAVLAATEHQLALRVCSYLEPGNGTLIGPKVSCYGNINVAGITYFREQIQFTLQGVEPNCALDALLLQPLQREHIAVDMLIEQKNMPNLANYSFIIHQDEYNVALPVIKNLTNQGQIQGMTTTEHLAKLTVVGQGLAQDSVALKQVSTALDLAGIQIQLMAAGDNKISAAIGEECVEQGVIALHETFALAKSE